jgi:hypothetical protein
MLDEKEIIKKLNLMQQRLKNFKNMPIPASATAKELLISNIKLCEHTICVLKWVLEMDKGGNKK